MSGGGGADSDLYQSCVADQRWVSIDGLLDAINRLQGDVYDKVTISVEMLRDRLRTLSSNSGGGGGGGGGGDRCSSGGGSGDKMTSEGSKAATAALPLHPPPLKKNSSSAFFAAVLADVPFKADNPKQDLVDVLRPLIELVYSRTAPSAVRVRTKLPLQQRIQDIHTALAACKQELYTLSVEPPLPPPPPPSSPSPSEAAVVGVDSSGATTAERQAELKVEQHRLSNEYDRISCQLFRHLHAARDDRADTELLAGYTHCVHLLPPFAGTLQPVMVLNLMLSVNPACTYS